jgi:putative flippase GtrA
VTRPARELLSGLVRYGLVGLANAATYYGTYLLVLPPAGYLVAHAVGLGAAMVVSFLLNCRFTFRVRPTWTRFLLYPASQVVNILATTIGVVGLVHLGVGERLAPLVAAALALPVSFLAARFVITSAVLPGPAPCTPAPASADTADAVTRPIPLPER